MNYLKKLQDKFLQMETKVKQRTHAIDLLVSGQTAANQRSLSNTRSIKELRKTLDDTILIIRDTNIDNRLKFRAINCEIQKNKRSILWLKAWCFGLTIFNIVMGIWFTIQMF